VPQKARILLVDDRAENLIALEAILSSLNQQLVPVRSGEAALKALLTEEFAVILLDVVMPGMDGFETAAHIKRRAKTHDVPIIFLTAAGAEPDHAFRGYAAGAVDYIAKPFDPWVLRAKVAVFVDLYMKNRQLREQAELLRQHAEGSADGGEGVLAELARRVSAVEVTAAGIAALPVVKTDTPLADGVTQLEEGVGRLRDILDALGATEDDLSQGGLRHPFRTPCHSLGLGFAGEDRAGREAPGNHGGLRNPARGAGKHKTGGPKSTRSRAKTGGGLTPRAVRSSKTGPLRFWVPRRFARLF
jgi:CheY-like chemotaxis protein